MPYIVLKKNGKKEHPSFLFLERDVVNLARDRKNCYTLMNTTTRRTRKVGMCNGVSAGLNGSRRRRRRKR